MTKPGDQRFHAVLEQIGDMHARKSADYGIDGDPFRNIRASEEWGIPAWLGALIRGSDKTFAVKGTLANEGVEDSLLDLASYAIIALVLYREEQQCNQSQQSFPRLAAEPELEAFTPLQVSPSSGDYLPSA